MSQLYSNPDFPRRMVEDRYLTFEFDQMGFTMLHWASRNNNFEMCKMLIENVVESNFKSCKYSKITIIKKTKYIKEWSIIPGLSKPVRWKSDPNRQDEFGRTPLFLAVQNCNIEIVKLLCLYHAIPRIQNFAGTSST